MLITDASFNSIYAVLLSFINPSLFQFQFEPRKLLDLIEVTLPLVILLGENKLSTFIYYQKSIEKMKSFLPLFSHFSPNFPWKLDSNHQTISLSEDQKSLLKQILRILGSLLEVFQRDLIGSNSFLNFVNISASLSLIREEISRIQLNEAQKIVDKIDSIFRIKLFNPKFEGEHASILATRFFLLSFF